MLFRRKSSPGANASSRTLVDDRLLRLEATRQEIFQASTERQRDDFEQAEESRSAGAADRATKFHTFIEDIRARFELSQTEQLATFEVAHKERAQTVRDVAKQRQREFLKQVQTHDALTELQHSMFSERAKSQAGMTSQVGDEAHRIRERECESLKDSWTHSLKRIAQAQDKLFTKAEAERNATVQEVLKGAQRKDSKHVPADSGPSLRSKPAAQGVQKHPSFAGDEGRHADAAVSYVSSRRPRSLPSIPRTSSDASMYLPLKIEPPRVIVFPSRLPSPTSSVHDAPAWANPYRHRHAHQPPSVGKRHATRALNAEEVCERNEARRDAVAEEAEAAQERAYDAAESHRNAENGGMWDCFSDLEAELQQAFQSATSKQDAVAEALRTLAADDEESRRTYFSKVQTRRDTLFRALVDGERQAYDAQTALADERMAMLQADISHLKQRIITTAQARREAVFMEMQGFREEQLGVKIEPAAPVNAASSRMSSSEIDTMPLGRSPSPDIHLAEEVLTYSAPEETRISHQRAPRKVPRQRKDGFGLSPGVLLNLATGLTKSLPVVEGATSSPSASTPPEVADALRDLERWCAAKQEARERLCTQAAQRRKFAFRRAERERVREFEGAQRERAKRAARSHTERASKFAQAQLSRETRFLEDERDARKVFAEGQAEREQTFSLTCRARDREFDKVLKELMRWWMKTEETRSVSFRMWALGVLKFADWDQVLVAKLFEEEERPRRDRFKRAVEGFQR